MTNEQHPVGTTFLYNHKWIKDTFVTIVESDHNHRFHRDCYRCFMDKNRPEGADFHCAAAEACDRDYRSDRRDVYFVKAENNNK